MPTGRLDLLPGADRSSAPKHGDQLPAVRHGEPGVSTKPILLISGYSPFCETFFDDVSVPKDQLVGELNSGWDVAKYLLGHEREMISGMGLAADRARRSALPCPRRWKTTRCCAPTSPRFDVDALAFGR
jgi:alkylation response protein AidB-like acyl-CoA dehydrogenase